MDLIEGGLDNSIEHWYYSHKFKQLLKLIENEFDVPRKLIDVGAGSALFSITLLELFPKLSIIAIDTGYEEAQAELSSQRITYLKNGGVYLVISTCLPMSLSTLLMMFVF